ncbi:MAG: hypothetical protein SGILL_002440 [Bacillariaceae sp.]
MFNYKIILFVFLCVAAQGNAAIRGVKRQQLQDDEKSYDKLLSGIDEAAMKRIHSRYLKEKSAKSKSASADVAETEILESSMSLSMSMSMSLSMSLSMSIEFASANSLLAIEARNSKTTKAPKSSGSMERETSSKTTKAPKASKTDPTSKVTASGKGTKAPKSSSSMDSR